MLEFPVGKKFDGLSLFPEESRLKQQVRFHDGIFWETIKVFEVEENESFLEGRSKSPLGKTSLQGHLSPLKSRSCPPSCAGILTFGSFAGCLAVARADPSSHPFTLLP